MLYVNGNLMEIQITRPNQFQDKIRNYNLIIDGEKVTEIKPNSTQKISIPDNAEYIQAKIDWCSSPIFYINSLTSDKLIVKNSFGDSLIKILLFFGLYYITFGKEKYLVIENDI